MINIIYTVDNGCILKRKRRAEARRYIKLISYFFLKAYRLQPEVLFQLFQQLIHRSFQLLITSFVHDIVLIHQFNIRFGLCIF